MKNIRRQKGATLLVGMIMLVVLTLLVVFAIRSSNTGLQVAGNMQAKVEADGAVSRAIETTIELFMSTDDLALINANPAMQVKVGDKVFAVAVAKPLCEMEHPILEKDLNAAENPNDVPCVEGSSGFNPVFVEDAASAAVVGLSSRPSACKQQRWKLEATLSDPSTGATVTHVQGIGVRVAADVECP